MFTSHKKHYLDYVVLEFHLEQLHQALTPGDSIFIVALKRQIINNFLQHQTTLHSLLTFLYIFYTLLKEHLPIYPVVKGGVLDDFCEFLIGLLVDLLGDHMATAEEKVL